MLSGKHYLLVLMAAVLLQICCAEDVETEAKPQMDTQAENEAEDPQLAQSPWAVFGQNFGSSIIPYDNGLKQTLGVFFPALTTLINYAGLNNDWAMPRFPNFANADILPAASDVMLVLADDKRRSRNVKRSPILSPELLRQIRQSSNPADIGQFLAQIMTPVNQMLAQAPNGDQDSLQQSNLQQMLSQMVGQIRQLGQGVQPMLGQALVNDENAAPSADSIVGQAQNTFNDMMAGLGQMFGSSSEISEVRVKPDVEKRTQEELLVQSLNDKKLPILWFRDAQQDAAEYKKTPEEIILQQKLYAFERQVIRELRLLQAIERQAREMQAANKGMSAKVTKGAEYKVNYPLNQKPMHKITMQDIEQTLADEFVRKMLQKQAPTKRQSPAFNQQEIAQMMAYALRGATGTKETAQTMNNDKDMNMEMGEIQSIDQLQRNWMQPQYNAEQMRWANEKMNIQQAEAVPVAEAEGAQVQQAENVANMEEINESERHHKTHKGHKKGA